MNTASSSQFSGDTLLKVEDLTKTVSTATGSLTILSSISFTIKPGETVAITGASGSGKSTLLSLLAGLDLPTSGSVTLCGERLETLDEDGRATVRGRHVGFVFQSFQLLPSLTALENSLLPLEVLGQADKSNAAKTWLERVGLGARMDHYPRQLSGGEQQRVAIARAFITEPGVLFADEPTGNLDSATGKTIIDLLFELNQQQNTTLILVTHDQALAERCQRRIELDGGNIMSGGDSA
jgi:putative ABC transport system ATP-binding protein